MVDMSLMNSTPLNQWAKHVSASEAKTRFGSLVDWSVQHQQGVVVEKHGEPTAVIMPYGNYQEFLALKREADQKQALETFRQLRQDVRACNPNMTEAQAQAFADDFTNEVMDAVIEKRQQKYG